MQWTIGIGSEFPITGGNQTKFGIFGGPFVWSHGRKDLNYTFYWPGILLCPLKLNFDSELCFTKFVVIPQNKKLFPEYCLPFYASEPLVSRFCQFTAHPNFVCKIPSILYNTSYICLLLETFNT